MYEALAPTAPDRASAADFYMNAARSYTLANQRDKAKAFLTKVKTDLASHSEAGQVVQFIDQIGGELYLPGVGDEMKIAFTDLKGAEIDLEKMKDKVVLVDFWATWCGPCRMVAPVLEEIATEQGEKVKIAKLDVDANPITAGRFGVRSIPTMILFKNGREAQRVVGYMPKEKLLQQLQPHISGTAAA